MIGRKNTETNLSHYIQELADIKKCNVSGFEDEQLRDMMQALRKLTADGEQLQYLLPKTFALVREAVIRTLGLIPFDTQLLAAAAMASEHIIELPTGEGKTLAAVFTACLGALSGKGVHVLTFNDYLARRDALWMKPVYEFLGLSVSYINEGMDKQTRKNAYNADVTYLTAKESGFDYLKSFLVYDTDSIVQRPFHLAIIDEADSILIDEARVPLVVAGDVPAKVSIDRKILDVVNDMRQNTHYETDEYANNISLTERGVSFVEEQLELRNLYDKQNIDLLTKINMMLQAVYLLKKDIDYIVKNDEVLLVDEFTGRITKNRQWPDGLQSAVELKEGVTTRTHGVVMNRITLQSFLQFYPALCGMTGTARASADEFYEFYERHVTVIPSNKPCIRIDRDDMIFTDKKSKMQAIAREISKVHMTGRPILVGTQSVEESEHLAELLRPNIPQLAVLNAKNDEEEAEVIANAGKIGAVTISTNMAGRGVDIRLGAGDEEEYKKICALGGLYVIGTNRYESVRIDNQLRGRAGRQGDPGESRFFISLEDDLLVKYHVTDSIPTKIRTANSDGLLTHSAINRAVLHTQRVAQGQTLDAKITLSKYSSVTEDQRKIVHEKREGILYGTDTVSVLEDENPDKLRELLSQVTEDAFLRAQKQIELFSINQCWADHLAVIEGALDEVQVISRMGQDPLANYNRKLIEAFDDMEDHIHTVILEIFDRVIVRDGKIDLDQMGIHGPSSTRTYMVNDGSEQFSPIGGMTASAVNAPLYGIYLLYSLYDKRFKKKSRQE